jgi:hypothetical protein
VELRTIAPFRPTARSEYLREILVPFVAQHTLLEKPNWDKVKVDLELDGAFLAKAQREVAEA